MFIINWQQHDYKSCYELNDSKLLQESWI